MKYSDFYNKYLKAYTKKTFKNELGERFYIVKTKTVPPVYLVTGDETDWNMQPLSHPKFNIYSDNEVRELGKILQEFNKSKKEN